MHTVYPPLRDTGAPVIPFAVGAQAFADGVPYTANRYRSGTAEHARFEAGWLAARNVERSEVAEAAVSGAVDA